jgi:hypothetical protein
MVQPDVARASSRSATFLRRAGLVALALAAFEVTAALLRARTPWPEEYGLRAKCEYFAEHRDEFDLVFLGSSRFFRGIDPRVVDAELAARGLTVRSFNFGLGGMRRFEGCFVLDRALELRPARLRWVVVEGEPWDASADFLGNTWSSRVVMWHDWEHTRLALQSVALEPAPLAQRLSTGWTHLQLCAMRFQNMGQGQRIALDLLGRSYDPWGRGLSAADVERAAGYQAYEEIAGDARNVWQEQLAARPEHAREIMDGIVAQNAAPPRLERVNLAALRAQQAAIRAAGARMIVVTMPASRGSPDEAALHARGDVPVLIELNRPDRDPRWWSAEARFDDLHLSRTGAVALSRALATALEPHLR